jgi:hypothetical protein
MCIVRADAALYIELQHWKSGKRRMSTLGWAWAPWEALVDDSGAAAPGAGGPAARAGQLSLHLYRKPLEERAHLGGAAQLHLKPLHAQQHDLFLTIADA